MEIHFTKYQGTGNDFVMLDNLSGKYEELSVEDIAFICDRKIGVGADGLIKISRHPELDFEVEYYNADGSQSFCGNGARCSVAFARELGCITNQTKFFAIDGIHRASIDGNTVRLEMLDVEKIDRVGDDYFVDTGSPHYVHLKKSDDPSILEFGRKIRYSEEFKKEGVNVNYLINHFNQGIEVETYERGVENETLSCGTGVTGCALVSMLLNDQKQGKIEVKTKGGRLTVEAESDGIGFHNIWLSGPAIRVFNGIIEL